LEIVSPLTWGSVDKYSFAQDEHALCVNICSLDVKVSGMAQRKQFVVVGTAIVKGEDVTVRGKVFSAMRFTFKTLIACFSISTDVHF
jgi:cleavage and polyadenylation specificity factor subunit 1